VTSSSGHPSDSRADDPPGSAATWPDWPAGPGGPGLPLVLDVSGRPCLVVGGGPVAARKIRSLVEAGAVVTVVAPEVVTAVDTLAAARSGVVTVERRPYRSGEASGHALVVTATGDPTVDDRVVADARAAGVLVNRADGNPEGRRGTVQLPAVLRRGLVTVAVSTGGASPALSRWLRDRLAASLPAELATVAGLLDEARAALRAAGRPTDSVRWTALLDDTLLPLVEAGRVDDARAALRAALTGTDDSSGEAGPGAPEP